MSALRQAGLLAATAAVLAGKVLFRADFETADLSQWNNTGTRGQNNQERNIAVVKGLARSGDYAARVTIHADDIFNAQQLRAQLGGPRVTVAEGDETFLSFWLRVEDPPRERDNFFYWEGNPPPRYRNVMTWWLEPGSEGQTLSRYGTGNLGRDGVHWTARFSPRQWHQLGMQIRWSEDETKGFVRLWFDGEIVLEKQVRAKGPEAVYFCQPGIHRSPHTAAEDTIYFDDFLLGETLADIAITTPSTGKTAPR